MIDDEQHFVRDAFYVLFKHRWRIVLVTLTGLLSGLAYNRLAGANYTATARIVVTAMAAPAIPPEGQGPVQTLVFEDRGQTARNQAELFSDPGVTRPLLPALEARLRQGRHDAVDRAIAWLRAQAGLEEDLPGRLSRALQARAVGDTDVVLLHFTWTDPAFAAEALNQLLLGYAGSITQAAEARQAMKVADAGLAEAEAQLRALDAQLAATPVGGDAGTLESERDRVRRRLESLHADGDALRVEHALASRKLDKVVDSYNHGGWVDSPDAQDTPAGAPELQQTFVTLLDKHQMMLTHLPPDNPKVRAVDKQIGEVREQNFLAVKQVLTTRLADLDERMARLNTDIAADEASARDLDDRLVKIEALSQTRAAAAAREAAEQRRLDDARLQIDAVGRQVSGLRVLSQATPPTQPDAPSPMLVRLLATLCGLALGVTGAFLAEATRRTLDRPRDIMRLLDLEVLARVPDLPRAADAR